MIELVSALLIAGATAATHQVGPDSVGLRVRVYAHKEVEEATRRRALEMADALLVPAGLVVTWLCHTAESCPVEDTQGPDIVVILSSRNRQDGRENCGLAAHGTRDSAGTVIVSVPCVEGVAFRLTRRAGTRTDPLLAMPRHDDVVGAVVAHEIAHLLGIRHARAGLMRATLETADLIALRTGKLRFSQAEATLMRIAVSSAGHDRLHASAAGPRQNPQRP